MNDERRTTADAPPRVDLGVEAPKGGRELATLPHYLDVEDLIAKSAEQENVMRMAAAGELARLESYLQSREKACEILRTIALKATHGQDWTLYKDPDGHEIGVPRDSAAVVIRKWLGIHIYNLRPLNSRGEPDPIVQTEDKDDNGKAVKVRVVEMWGSGFSTVTGEVAEDVYFSRRSDEPFVGRGTIQDLKASCRTGLDGKIVRILSGLRKVPKEQLLIAGLREKDFHLGMGFGRSSDRAATRVAEEGVEELRERLRKEVLRVSGGVKSDAVKILLDCTKGEPDPKNPGKEPFKGFDSVDRMTKVWQFEGAFERLKAHPLYAPPAAPAAASQANGQTKK